MNQPDLIANTLDSGASDETLSVLGPTVRILAEYGACDDDLCLIYGEMGPGVSVPLHSHVDGENWYVVRGTVQVFRDGQGWSEIAAGASFSIVDGVRHALHNRAAAAVGMLLITTVRMARFFRAIGTPAETTPAGPPSVEALGRLADAAQRFGYGLASPADNAAIGLRLG